MELIELENLKRYYGSYLALDVHAIRLPRGAVGLLGPNGAGKSTLLKILMGLLPPSGGRASVLGMDVLSCSIGIRSRVGYVSEVESLVPGLSVMEFVSLAGELAGMTWRDAHRRAYEVLTYLGVDDSLYRKVEDLSMGMKRRVQLAQALIHEPELLILDEPTNGLDPAGRQAMLELIRILHRDFGKSVILSSHLLDDVDRICDSVIILDCGIVLAHGRIDVLRAHVRNRYRLGLKGDPAGLVVRLRAAGATVKDESRPGTGESELSVEVPQGFSPSRFFELLQRTNEESGRRPEDGDLVLRTLVPEEEKLRDIFQRIMESGEVNVAG